jgi:hypothetical protein
MINHQFIEIPVHLHRPLNLAIHILRLVDRIPLHRYHRLVQIH